MRGNDSLGLPDCQLRVDSRLRGNDSLTDCSKWIPAFAGMTGWVLIADSGLPDCQLQVDSRLRGNDRLTDCSKWIPAFAGMTGWVADSGLPD
ncbi:hypothetical protein QUF72_16765 [Desulfobacterales bacterium HSG2]|nr:hypothetical protein [Desulfobacterales bacterium HSG2]